MNQCIKDDFTLTVIKILNETQFREDFDKQLTPLIILPP